MGAADAVVCVATVGGEGPVAPRRMMAAVLLNFHEEKWTLQHLCSLLLKHTGVSRSKPIAGFSKECRIYPEKSISKESTFQVEKVFSAYLTHAEQLLHFPPLQTQTWKAITIPLF